MGYKWTDISRYRRERKDLRRKSKFKSRKFVDGHAIDNINEENKPLSNLDEEQNKEPKYGYKDMTTFKVILYIILFVIILTTIYLVT